MSTILLCCRTTDSLGITGRIYDRLVEQFGRDAVTLLDVDAGEITQSALDELSRSVQHAAVVVATIGQHWLRGLDDVNDPVRSATGKAFNAQIPVIPVLVNGARMPSERQIPAELKDFALRNAFSVKSDQDFDGHVDRLGRVLRTLISQPRKSESAGVVQPVVSRPPSPPQLAPTHSDRPRAEGGTRVFISHSSEDRKFAETICRALESRGQPCWLAARDVKGGENYQEAIVDAIGKAKAMVLVFTATANNSDEIKKEVSLASQYKLKVIPVRLEDVKPSGAFAYELVTRQWIDFFDNWEGALNDLSARVAGI